jgi:aryl-alcohol dehydrogenase-like predicted oxidoreductase
MPLWPEYDPWEGQLQRIATGHQLAVLAHAHAVNLGLHLVGEADASGWRPRWIDRWNHAENPAIVRRVRSLAALREVSPLQILLHHVLNRPFPTFGIVPLSTLGNDRREDYFRATQLVLTAGELDSLTSP